MFELLQFFYRCIKMYGMSIVNKLNTAEITTLWCIDKYDGPISGVCNYKNKTYWFDVLSIGGWEDLEPENIKLVLEKYKCTTKSELLNLDDTSLDNLTFNGNELFVYYDDMQPDVYISHCVPRRFYLKKLSWWQLKIEQLLQNYFLYIRDNDLIYKDADGNLTGRAKLFYYINRKLKSIRKKMYKKVVGWF